jgi:hypothetical protein
MAKKEWMDENNNTHKRLLYIDIYFNKSQKHFRPRYSNSLHIIMGEKQSFVLKEIFFDFSSPFLNQFLNV